MNRRYKKQCLGALIALLFAFVAQTANGSNLQRHNQEQNKTQINHHHRYQQQQQNFKRQQQQPDDVYQIGVGIADITGPAADINLMGYAKPNQDAGGIHLRQFSRATIIEDYKGRRVAYISLDNGMISQLLRLRVLERLEKQFGAGLYTENNLMMTATHTHSTPGGFFQYLLYNIPSQGFISQTLVALVDGVLRSVERAHNSMRSAKIYYARGELLGASVNRSPTSYNNNPASERALYEHNTDKTMHLLRIVDSLTDEPFAMLNWFPVHGTSMNNTNHLISSDNKGYASLLFEERFNKPSTLPGKGPFVATFAQANEGDVSPNTEGPRCIDTGLPCDETTSTCDGQNEKCIAFGPGKDMFESTKIIAYRQFSRALSLFEDTDKQVRVRGPIKFAHQHIDMSNQIVPNYRSAAELLAKIEPPSRSSLNSRSDIRARVVRINPPSLITITPTNLTTTTNLIQSINNQEMPQSIAAFQTCLPALGYSFAAGTTDGPGAFDFKQSDTGSTPMWNMVRNMLRKPSSELVECQKPKPILLSTGEMGFPYPWHPRIVPTQIISIGQLAIVGLPGEFTTQSGRRLAAAVAQVLNSPDSSSPSVSASASASASASSSSGSGSSSASAAASASGSSSAAAAAAASTVGASPISKSSLTGRSQTNQANHDDNMIVILSGLSNIYTSYVTTVEEYEMQRYEAASTLYGPHTLQAYINQFVRLANYLRRDEQPPDSKVSPPDLSNHQISLKPPVLFDSAPSGKHFGDVLLDVNTSHAYKCGDIVLAAFVAGNPRNDLRQEDSFLFVERFEPQTKIWLPIANDASWDTKFIWRRTNTMFGESQALIEWHIPPVNCVAGVYRLRYFGSHKNLLQNIRQYSGQSSNFAVVVGVQDLAFVESILASGAPELNAHCYQASNNIDNNNNIAASQQTNKPSCDSSEERQAAATSDLIANQNHNNNTPVLQRPSSFSSALDLVRSYLSRNYWKSLW